MLNKILIIIVFLTGFTLNSYSARASEDFDQGDAFRASRPLGKLVSQRCEQYENLTSSKTNDGLNKRRLYYGARFHTRVNNNKGKEKMPTIEELFSSKQKFGVDLEKAKQRQKLIRKDGTLSLDDPATHIVNLFTIKEFTYPRAKRMREKTDQKLEELSLKQEIRKESIKLVDASMQKHSKRKSIKKIKKGGELIKNDIYQEMYLIKIEADEIKDKLEWSLMYHPDKIRKDAFGIVDKISEHMDSKDSKSKLRSILVHFD